MNKKILVLMGITIILINGCATIISGRTQKITLLSTDKQNVQIDGTSYSSPSIINIDRSKEDKIVTVDGCDKKIILKSKMNPAFFGNILLGGLLGSTTDATTNSMWKYSEDNITVDCNNS